MKSVILLAAIICSVYAHGEGSNRAALPNIEEPLAAANHHYEHKSLRSGSYNNYGSVNGYPLSQSYGNDYGSYGYESSPQNYGFNCYGRQPALYGDANYDCRIFHVCQADGRQDTMRCPKQTRFNNYLGVCDWEQKIDQTCMPLYKEEYTNSYGSSRYEQGGYSQGYRGSQSYDRNQYRRRR